MRNRKDSEKPQAEQQVYDFDADHYPTATGALRRLLDDPALPDGQVDRIEIRAQANGELTWRIRPARGDLYEVGYQFPA